MTGIVATQVLKGLLIVFALFQLAPAQARTLANSLTDPSAHLRRFSGHRTASLHTVNLTLTTERAFCRFLAVSCA
jgi:uncharacterized protein YjeT (DUF2065 family)